MAPYESDSQLAKLQLMGIIDQVITEDSDLLVYGASVIFKLNEDGECDYLDLSKVKTEEVGNENIKKFLKLSREERMIACVLAGCDYLPSIKGIGLRKAMKYMEDEKDIFGVV